MPYRKRHRGLKKKKKREQVKEAKQILKKGLKKTTKKHTKHHSPKRVRWKAQSRAVLAGGWASCCDRAIRIGADRRGEEEEEEEEEETEEEERGKPALLSYRGNRKER